MNYKSTSPYFNTNLATDGNYLDFWEPREIVFSQNDKLYEITPKYNQRPDLLAFDVYGNSAFWWVFASRNPNVLLDPIGDFVTGTVIFLPSVDVINALKS